MAKVIWTDDVIVRLGLIVEYINLFDPSAATRMGQRLITASESLCDFPNRGRPAGDGYRELPSIRPYIILYEVDGDAIFILDVRHGAQAPRDA